MEQGRPAWAEIDLDAIEHNIRQLKKLIGKGVELMTVVKANGYGHGASQVARVALEAGATRLAVACVDEGIQLRRAGITQPILILGYVPPWEAREVVNHNLQITVTMVEQCQALATCARAAGTVAGVHLKVDTGFGRYGLLPEELVGFALGLSELPELHIEGLWTHFASADERDKRYTRRQLAVYQEAAQALNSAGIKIPCRHVANSAATLEMPETHLDMVRCGIATYGLWPSAEVERTIELRPAMSLKARVGRVRVLPEGSPISYGRTFTTTEKTPVALVPLGYADGIRRLLSNQGQVLVRGKRAPIVGRICMDQFVINTLGIDNVEQNDEVVVLGTQGTERISADDLADELGTINYEIVCDVAARVPRVYFRHGEVVEIVNLLGRVE